MIENIETQNNMKSSVKESRRKLVKTENFLETTTGRVLTREGRSGTVYGRRRKESVGVSVEGPVGV